MIVLIWRVREEPNLVQRCQFGFFIKQIIIKLAQKPETEPPEKLG